MAFEVIQGFNVSKNEAVDPKRLVAVDEAAMLSIKWVYDGLICVRTDFNPRKQFICKVPSATQSGAPNYTSLTDWEEFTGTAGADGSSGSVWFDGTGAPSDVTGIDGDYYLNSTTGDYYKKIANTWGSPQGQLSGPAGPNGTDGDIYATSSNTSVDISSAITSITLTVDSGLSYTAGQEVIVASLASPLSDYFTATVVSYSGNNLSLGNTTYTGTGIHTDWDVNITGSPGKEGTVGKGFIHSEFDITLNQAKITSVQNGSPFVATVENPYNASVKNDFQDYSIAALQGDMSKNSISWDGTNWYNNGRWVGLDGSAGSTGATGDTGATGLPGDDGVVQIVNKTWNIGGSSGNLITVVSSFDNVTSGNTYTKRIKATIANAHLSDFFYLEFPSTLVDLKDLESFTFSVDATYKRRLICRALSGKPATSFYNNNSGTHSSTFILSDYINGTSGSFTFTPHISGNTVTWSVIGGGAVGNTGTEGPNFVATVNASGTIHRVHRHDGQSWKVFPIILSFGGSQTRLAGYTGIKLNGVKLSSEVAVLITPRDYKIHGVWLPVSGTVNITDSNDVSVNAPFTIAVYL